ncbi:MAG: acox [Firmicutes bacterium]|nr:acox [Bacillota bacterium]
MSTVGIIANPASGRDIRRLVAYGTVFDNQEKTNIVRRILLGLAATGVEKVFFMPDYYGIVTQAVEGLLRHCQLPIEILPIDICLSGTQIDSQQAALAMRNIGVGCILTLGGDGTNRMVAKDCGDVPLLPVSTGTNNVFSVMIEGTTAGLAAGVVASCAVNVPDVVRRTKKLIIEKSGQAIDIALIDAVVLDNHFIGSRALWNVEGIRQIVITRGEPHNIGISSIGGNLAPIGAYDSKGMSIYFGNNTDAVLAPIAPGIVVPVPFENFLEIGIGDTVKILHTPCLIAVDGEREVEIKSGDEVSIRLTMEGPLVIDVHAALAEAAAKGFFRKQAAQALV